MVASIIVCTVELGHHLSCVFMCMVSYSELRYLNLDTVV
jgi:hypothetical protein